GELNKRAWGRRLKFLPHARLFRLFLFSGVYSHFPNATVEVCTQALFRSFSAFFAHFREVVYAILCHISIATFFGDSAVIFSATFLLEYSSSHFSDASIIIFAILVADRATPLAACLRC